MFIARAENPQTTIQRESVDVSQELARLAIFIPPPLPKAASPSKSTQRMGLWRPSIAISFSALSAISSRMPSSIPLRIHHQPLQPPV